MKFTSINYTNFGPFVDVTMRLDDRGLILVQGENQISTSADSNGSGKSMLLEGIVWALFGKTIRYDLKGKSTGDAVVNTRFGPTPGKGCVVTVNIESAGQQIEISRYRKHKTGKNTVQVSVDGVDYTRGTNKETDRFIEELVGLDFNSFIRSVYFDGSSIIPFPTLSDSEIKATFEKVLGLEDLNKVAGVVKDWLRVEKGNVASVDNDIRLKESERSTANVEEQTAKDRFDRFESDRRAEIDQLRQQIEAIEQRTTRPAKDIDKDLSDLDDRTHKLNTELEQINGVDQVLSNLGQQITTAAQQVSALEGEKAKLEFQKTGLRPEESLQQQYEQAQRDMHQASKTYDAATDAMNNAERKIGEACGECGKPYTKDDLGHIVEHQRKLGEQAAADYQVYKAAWEKARAAIDEDLANTRAAIDKQIAAKQQEVAQAQSQVDALREKQSKLETLRTKREQLQRELQEIPQLRSKLEAEKHQAERDAAEVKRLSDDQDKVKRKPNPYIEDVERWRKRKDEAAAEVEKLEKRKSEIETKIAQLKVLENAYGRTGLKAHILETVTPVLNMRANDYAQKLADGSVKIEFNTVTKNKDGSLAERFSVDVSNAQGADGYHGNSGGERRKIDLSIALAMSDLVAARASKAVDLWVADEIAETLDPTALERVVDVLNDKAKERGTLLTISHTDMTHLIPQVCKVRKTMTGSVLA